MSKLFKDISGSLFCLAILFCCLVVFICMISFGGRCKSNAPVTKVIHDTVYVNKIDTNRGKYFLISYYAMNGEEGKYSYGNVTMSCTGGDNIPNDSCLKNYVYNSIKCDAPWTKNRIGIMGITPLTEYDFNHFYDGDKNFKKFNPCK